MQTNQSTVETKGLFSFLQTQDDLSLSDRVHDFDIFLSKLKANEHYSYQRPILTPTDRYVVIQDPYTNQPKKMWMFASNNYLGLANHPYVKKEVRNAINKYGVGMAGPPLLNGYSVAMQALENKIADFKKTESAIIFPAGFMANVGVVSALAKKNDVVIFDQLSHASFYAGLDASKATHVRFPHNDVQEMERRIKLKKDKHSNVFVSMEGIYSMDGDIAPLDEMAPICKKHGAYSILDDAHGVGVLGKNGRGTAEFFGVEEQIDLYVGTFSKVFTVTGGYLAGPKGIIEYLRYFARPYIFSAALSPMHLAAVSAGIDVIEREPERRLRLLGNAQFVAEKLENYGLLAKPAAAIIALQVPPTMDIRKANRMMHELGFFVNAIEYPAVAAKKQRFRISITADHKRSDLESLINCIDKVWNSKDCRT